eukprot:gene33471-41304_t
MSWDGQLRAAPKLWWRIAEVWWLTADRRDDSIYFAKFPVFGRSVITIGKVWNVWPRVWTGGTLFSTDMDVDTEALNECLREEFYFE